MPDMLQLLTRQDQTEYPQKSCLVQFPSINIQRERDVELVGILT